jgi:predicted transposase YbfD/YdcC
MFVGHKVGSEVRYYFTSPRPDPAMLDSVIRQHWRIENKLQ